MPGRLGSTAGRGKIYSGDRLIGPTYYEIHIAQHRGVVEATGLLSAATSVLDEAADSDALRLELETGGPRVAIVVTKHMVTGLSHDSAYIKVSDPVPQL